MIRHPQHQGLARAALQQQQAQRVFQVVGGDVLGWDASGELDGADQPQGAMVQLPPRPRWRNQLAPGVPDPGEGLENLPMRALTQDGIFTATAAGPIDFLGKPQAPFRAERLLVTVGRNGTSAAGILVRCSGIFVGNRLQQMQQGDFNVEQFSPTAFGVRLCLVQAAPGVEITMRLFLANGALANADTIGVDMQFLGRSIR
jgi:hypothetical protein